MIHLHLETMNVFLYATAKAVTRKKFDSQMKFNLTWLLQNFISKQTVTVFIKKSYNFTFGEIR